MAVDLSALSTVTTSALALSNLILVNPQQNIGYQPQLKGGKNEETGDQPPAFLFNYEGEQSVNLQSDVTDHYVEDNTAIQDQIALRPEIINTHGFIGELNDVAPKALVPLKKAAEKLIAVQGYVPELSIAAQLAYDNAFLLYQSGQSLANSAVATWATINGTNGLSQVDSNTGQVSEAKAQTKQQLAFLQFYGYWRSRTLFTVQTPWAVFKNCAIMNFRAIQGEDTTVITDFEISFKPIRFAETIKELATVGDGIKYDNTKMQSRAFNQGAPLVDLGTTSPVDVGPFPVGGLV